MKNKNSLSGGGFTFIELLVSISIILLLSSVAVVSFQSSAKRARDNKRKADLEQVRAALEMIRSDMGCYPGGSGDCNSCSVTWGSELKCGNNTYMNKLPQDPKSGNDYTYYYSFNEPTSYDLCAYLETGEGDPCGECIIPSSGDPTPCNYQLSSP